ncbi:hypothetical protein HK098_001472 [Nowakowskiella sp. JEL0407]|nr:hypothetical protein HK098_001472 [Nowakowskiella sp. JEL0407]
MDLLKQEEQRIDLKVLHHLNRDDINQKQNRFKRTVIAVHAIVSHKLYKSKSSSLEAYFRDSWKISRAQVYRFLDCAVVLKQLDGFTDLPCRERLCRALKQLARSRQDIRKLWDSVLRKAGNDQDSITSSMIGQVWAVLLANGEVTGLANPAEDTTELIGTEPPVLSDLEEDLEFNDLEKDDDMPSTIPKSKVSTSPSSNTPIFSQKPPRYVPGHPSETVPGSTGPMRHPSHTINRSHPYQHPQQPQNHPYYDSMQNRMSPPVMNRYSDRSYSPSQLNGNYANYHQSNNTESRGPTWRWSYDENGQDITQAEVEQCVKLLQKFSQRGYILQPALGGRWVESEVVKHWRLAPLFPDEINPVEPDCRVPIILTKHVRHNNNSLTPTSSLIQQRAPNYPTRMHSDKPNERQHMENSQSPTSREYTPSFPLPPLQYEDERVNYSNSAYPRLPSLQNYREASIRQQYQLPQLAPDQQPM